MAVWNGFVLRHMTFGCESIFASVMNKSGYEKWKVNEPSEFYFLLYIQSRVNTKITKKKKKKKKQTKKNKQKTVAGVARKQYFSNS